MSQGRTRRDVLRGSLVVAGLGLIGLPEWVLPALAQGETLVPFTDIPKDMTWETPTGRRVLDIRTIDGPLTPRDKFPATQHYAQPEIDASAFRLRVTGLVNRELDLSIAELQKLGRRDTVVGFECSGNRGPLHGLCGNGRWTGVPLKTVLAQAGVKGEAHEFVFFGADHGEEEVEWRTQKLKLDVPFGRSLERDKALSDEPFLAWALNGQPLSKFQGAPLRLVVPGWYGVANVKWLSEIHAQADPFLGKYQARWYRTIRAVTSGGRTRYVETAVTHMRLNSFVARVTRTGNDCTVLAVVLNDGTPIRSVEIEIDDGPWERATPDPATTDRYGWKLFTYTWRGPTPGPHTLVSRARDVTGAVQPTAEDNAGKRTFLEENSQAPRKVLIS